MMRILFVRHAQDYREYRGGWSQRGLIPEGVEQAHKLARALSDTWKPIEYLLSSDLPRAAQTVEIISQTLGLPVHYNPEWREINNGDLAGMHNDLAKVRYPGLFFDTLDIDEEYPNGESPRQHYTRVAQAFSALSYQMLTGALPRNIVLVTHGGVIDIVYHILNNQDWSNKRKPVPTGAASIHEVAYEEGEWRVIQENIIAHVKEE